MWFVFGAIVVACLVLDLVARPGKEENGFMHGPVPTVLAEGALTPARIHFTANAIPSQIGSGYKALATLFHEGGHAAHFSNIRMPAPCFSTPRMRRGRCGPPPRSRPPPW